jgi:AcrR family transcriptional regulator
VPASSKSNRGPSAGPENRRALIAAAREIFAVDGYAAPLSAVAKKAGVGQGSLYRHFPDRTALAVAVFDENLADLESLVASPDTTIDDLLNRIVEQARVSSAFIGMVRANPLDPRVTPIGGRMLGVITQLLVHEKAAGRLGAHVLAEDVMLAIEMLSGVVANAEPEQRGEVGRRAWALFHAAFEPH